MKRFQTDEVQGGRSYRKDRYKNLGDKEIDTFLSDVYRPLPSRRWTRRG